MYHKFWWLLNINSKNYLEMPQWDGWGVHGALIKVEAFLNTLEQLTIIFRTHESWAFSKVEEGQGRKIGTFIRVYGNYFT